ncbi:MAG TPA: hypothetical protein VG649_22630 [Candidatus Angelobacter sp.]|nr:hypothetical protein [Candidatus Angelobacter sp.]
MKTIIIRIAVPVLFLLALGSAATVSADGTGLPMPLCCPGCTCN